MPPQRPGFDVLVRKGVKEFGASGLSLLNFDTLGDEESFRVSVRGGVSFAYCLVQSLSLRIELAGRYFKQTSEGFKSDESSFQADAMVNDYLHIDRGSFWRPGIGRGFRIGNRFSSAGSAAPFATERAGVVGGHVRLDLGFAFFSTPRFNFKAGPEFFFAFGNHSPDDGSPDEGFFRIDAGFSIGAYYVF